MGVRRGSPARPSPRSFTRSRSTRRSCRNSTSSTRAGRSSRNRCSTRASAPTRRVKFTPKAAGKYRVRITDARTLGGPAYVYRLTVTTADVPEFHFPIKAKPDGLKDVTERKDALTLPVALNGRIAKAGDRERVEARTQEGHEVHVRPPSPALRVAAVRRGRASSTRPARNWRRPKRARPRTRPRSRSRHRPTARTPCGERAVPRSRRAELRVSAPCAGWHARRSNPAFGSRSRPTRSRVPRGGTLKVKVTAERFGGFAGPITVTADDLPKGVTAKAVIDCREPDERRSHAGGRGRGSDQLAFAPREGDRHRRAATRVHSRCSRASRRRDSSRTRPTCASRSRSRRRSRSSINT